MTIQSCIEMQLRLVVLVYPSKCPASIENSAPLLSTKGFVECPSGRAGCSMTDKHGAPRKRNLEIYISWSLPSGLGAVSMWSLLIGRCLVQFQCLNEETADW